MAAVLVSAQPGSRDGCGGGQSCSQERFPMPLVIRAETLAHEARCMVTPEQVASLSTEGISVVLEKSMQRVFTVEAFRQAVQSCRNPDNFVVVEPGAWQEKGKRFIVLGVKDPRAENPDFVAHPDSIYLHFDHSYKDQEGWRERLQHFVRSLAVLLDHEYFIDECGERTHAFGFSAGYATTAMSILSYCKMHFAMQPKFEHGEQHEALCRLPGFKFKSLEEFLKAGLCPDKEKARPDTCLATEPQEKHSNGIDKGVKNIRVLVLGGKQGKSAQGAIECLEDFNDQAKQLELGVAVEWTQWGRLETSSKQTDAGLEGIEAFDVILNCTGTSTDCPPFLTQATIGACQLPLQIIGDVTCDPMPKQNRVRVNGYKTTSFEEPAFYVGGSTYAITVDHSPTLFPAKASVDMANQFFPHLLQLMFDSQRADFLKKTLQEELVPAERAWERFQAALSRLNKTEAPQHVQ